MHIFKYFIGFGIAAGLLVSCESNDQAYLSMKDANVYFDTDQSRFVPSVSEDNKVLKVPLILAGIPGTYPISVTIEVDTAGVLNPAKEGVDFSIKKKVITFEEGYGTKYIEIHTIDNSVKNPVKQFELKIVKTSMPLNSNTENSITVSILDNEHPLQYLFGTYRAAGLDVFANKVERFNMIMSADPEDDDMVLIEGFPATPLLRAKLRIDMEAKQCWIIGGQVIDDNDPVYGLVMLCRCFRKDDGYLGYDYNDVPGTIGENGTVFTFTNWVGAVIISEGPNQGAAFFTFKDLTLEKAK